MTAVTRERAERTFLCDALMLREAARVVADMWPFPVGSLVGLALRSTARLLEVRGGVA